MSKRRKSTSGNMLDLWRPPPTAGEPVGCLATTYTFKPALFDEQCLARFLEIESEPDREDLAFLLEREHRLGGVYVGVLVDHTQAGVEHSLRWDVLPVRIHAGKQHAKVSLLVWARAIRLIVASANLTEQGYRFNYEVASAVDLTTDGSNRDLLHDVVQFLRSLLTFVPGASNHPPTVRRVEEFLNKVERQTRRWKSTPRRSAVRQFFVCTLPAIQVGGPARSSLDEAIQACRKRGGSPEEAWIASPFFDMDNDVDRATAALCKQMSRAGNRELFFSLPAIYDETKGATPRIAAPKALIETARLNRTAPTVEILPALDDAKNLRPWHAKMLGLFEYYNYSALMIGSSNFTCAGMGVGTSRNAEANLLTIADNGRAARQLEAVWPVVKPLINPNLAEWLGARPEQDEEEQTKAPPVPPGFLTALYRAGEARQISLHLDPSNLPKSWQVYACGRDQRDLFSTSAWRKAGHPHVLHYPWDPVLPPEKLLVRWQDSEAFLPLNVEDSRSLPRPAQLEQMSADDMLWILAAADPSAAFRAWARRQQPSQLFDDDLDSAIPVELDPLRRYDLQATFLHRIRRRARVLAQLRANLERPVWGQQALEWRLRGLVGVEALAERLAAEFSTANGSADESLLTLADFLIVLREVNYRPADGSLSKGTFDKVFRPFLRQLAARLGDQVKSHHGQVPAALIHFWERVVVRCRE